MPKYSILRELGSICQIMFYLTAVVWLHESEVQYSIFFKYRKGENVSSFKIGFGIGDWQNVNAIFCFFWKASMLYRYIKKKNSVIYTCSEVQNSLTKCSMLKNTYWALTSFIKEISLQGIPREFHYFVWNKEGKCWEERKIKGVNGRINGANSPEGERYYLRLLLNHVRSPTSFADLLMYITVCNVHPSKKLLKEEDCYNLMTGLESLLEITTFKMPLALRHLFAIVLVYCEPADVRKFWDLLHVWRFHQTWSH